MTRADQASHPSPVVEIYMKSDQLGSKVWFDPVGVYIEPGQTIRWIVSENVHTTTAYHPRNSNHSLRIPPNATPWDSGYLSPGEDFELKFMIQGVYDYYCMPHEGAGMVGRIIVGKPTGPGALPFDYYEGRSDTKNWRPVPPAAQKEFPTIERIMREKVVRIKVGDG
ncbi:MAG: plastocyanin/azurin family copper-binding protein [Deltaproteobacteria bacterium]